MTSSENVSGKWQSWQAKWELEDQESGAEGGLIAYQCLADFGENLQGFLMAQYIPEINQTLHNILYCSMFLTISLYY